MFQNFAKEKYALLDKNWVFTRNLHKYFAIAFFTYDLLHITPSNKITYTKCNKNEQIETLRKFLL